MRLACFCGPHRGVFGTVISHALTLVQKFFFFYMYSYVAFLSMEVARG